MPVVSVLRNWRSRWSGRDANERNRSNPRRKYRPMLELLEERLPTGTFFNGFGLSAAHLLPAFLSGGSEPLGASGLSDAATAKTAAQTVLGDAVSHVNLSLLDVPSQGHASGSSASNSGMHSQLGMDTGKPANSGPVFSDSAPHSGGGAAAPGMPAVNGAAQLVGALGGIGSSPIVSSMANEAAGAGDDHSASDLFHAVSAASVPTSQWSPRHGGPQPLGGGGNPPPPRPVRAIIALKQKTKQPPPPKYTGTGFIDPFGIPHPLQGPKPATVGVGTIVDASNFIGGVGGQEFEEDIAINPTNPNNIVIETNATANGFTVGSLGGNMLSFSFDGGNTWQSRYFATGDDGFDAACCDPSVAFDEFGNLFVSYFAASLDHADLLLSTDGGQTLKQIGNFADAFDQPKIAAAKGEIYDVWTSNTSLAMEGVYAAVTGLGQVGGFAGPTPVQNPAGAENFGRIAIGPNGQVLINYQSDPTVGSSAIPDTIHTSLSQGKGFGFSGERFAANTNIGVISNLPPEIPDRNPTTSFSSVAYDRSGGPHNGRAYLVYLDRPTITSTKHDVFLIHSDDDGSTWSAPVRVTDDSTGRPKWMPRVAVDQTNGDVAINWYDARNDNGDHGPGDLDGVAGDEGEEFITFSYDGGGTFEPNIQISQHASSAIVNPNVPGAANDYGDYQGLDFYSGIARPAWADNSQDLTANFDKPNSFDIATTAVQSMLSPPEDGYEPNETTDKASNLGTLTSFPMQINNLTISKHANGLYDYDNYKVTMGKPGTLTVTETEEISRGGLELHLFKLVGNTLVDVGDSTARLPLTRTLSVSVKQGDLIYIEAKGRNYAPGRMGTGFYHLNMSLA